MTLNDAQEAARLASMEYEDNEDDGHSVESDDNQNEPVEEMVCDFHDLQGSDHRGIFALQVIHELCTRYIGGEPETLVAAQTVIEDGI